MAKKVETVEDVAEEIFTTEVATQETHAVAEHRSSPFGRGLEGVDVTDIQIPVALLIQKASKLMDDRDFPHKAGDLVHGILLEKLDTPFIPLLVWKDNRFDLPLDTDKAAAVMQSLGIQEEMMFNPGKGCVCYAKDGKHGSLYGDCSACGKNQFDNLNNTPPLCSNRVNVFALFEGYDFPVLIRFGKTSRKHGQKFLQLLAFGGGDIFTRKYKITTQQKTDARNSWYEMEVKPVGKVEPERLPELTAWYERLMKANIIIEEANEEVVSEVVRETEY